MLVRAVLALSLLTVGTVGLAQAAEKDARAGDGRSQGDKEYTAEANPRPAGMPLSPLPEVPTLEMPEPRPEAVAALEGILKRLVAADAADRERAASELYEAKADWVAVAARKLDILADSANREAMDRALTKIRSKARQAAAAGGKGDYLEAALELAAPADKPWQDLVRLLGLGRALEAIGSPSACRELVRMYVRFDLVRLDVQQRLDRVGDGALPVLIETTRHPAPKVAEWAKRQLSLRGKAIPQEAVRTDDSGVLAGVLLALGRVGDPETARLLISFAGTERLEIRNAARQGLVLLGESAAWQLREAFQDTTGRTAPRDWTWKRLARELFTELDRTRLSRVYEIYEQALLAHKKGDLASMKEGFDRVLTQSPLFEGREAMAELYLEFAERHPDPPGPAEDALRRAERVAHDEATRKRVQSRLLVLRAHTLEKRGFWDRTLVERAVELDPDNVAATQALRAPSAGSSGWNAGPRYLVAITVSVLALGGVAWVLWTARRRPAQGPPPPMPPMPP